MSRHAISRYCAQLAVVAVLITASPAAAQTTNWTNTAGGSYFLGTNWDNGVPTTGYTANISVAGTYTVTFSGSSSTINSLTLNDANATFSQTGGTLALGTLNLMAGSYSLSGGTISGATITSTGGVIVTGPSAGILNAASIGAGALNLASTNTSLTIQGGTTFAAGSAYTLGGALTVSQSTEIDNLTLTLASGSIFHSPTSGITMTLGASTTVTTAATANITGVGGNSLANAGLIQETGNTFSLVVSGFGTVTNTGTGAQGIVASGGGAILLNPLGAFNNSGRVEAMANSTVTILATNWTNTGTFAVDNGATLNLEGTFTAAAIGTINRTGANTVDIVGSLNNASATLALTATTGSYLLNGGTITGGSITSDGVGTLTTGPSAGILSGVSVGLGALNLTSTNSSLTIQGGTTFAAESAYTLGGTFTVSQSTEIDNLTLTLSSGALLHSPTTGITVTLGANTTVTTAATAAITGIAGNSLANAGLIQETGSAVTLTINAFGTITNTGTGAQGIVASGGGGIFINPLGAFNNAGRVEAMANSTVTILATNWTNTGTFVVDNGATLNLEGTFTTAAIGTITRTGTNTVAIVGSLNNASATLALTAATGNYSLSGGTISGGSITSDGTGQLVITSTTGILSGVTIGVGALKMTGANSALSLQNGSTFAPGSAYTLNGLLSIDESNEVDNLTLTLMSNAAFRGATTAGLTIGATTTVTTAAAANVGTTGSPLTNAGLIQESGSGKTLLVTTATSITNTGSGSLGIVASGGGTVEIAPSTGTFNNSGRVEAMANSTVIIGGGVLTNSGTFIVDNGATLSLVGTYTVAGIGTIVRSGTNTINLGGTLNNVGATLALTAATGSYTLNGGTINGGSITSDGVGQLVVNSNSAILNGVALWAGALNLTSSNISLTIQGGTTFAPGSAYTLGGNGSLFVNQSTEIDNLSLTLGVGAGLHVPNNGITMTLGASTMVTSAASAGISGPAGSFLANAGTIQETGAGQSLIISVFGSVTNTGTLLASGGGQLAISTASGSTLTNVSGTTLTGGTYHVIGPASGTSTLNFGSLDVQTLGAGATVILENANSVFDVNTSTPIDNRLTTLAAGSQLQILNGRSYAVANPSNTFTNNGTLLVSSNAGLSTFTIGDGINFTSFAASTQTLSGGTYQIQGNATLALGSRQILTVSSGTTVTLAAIGSLQASFPALANMSTNNGTFQLLGGQNFTTAGALNNTGTIQLGGGTLTVNGSLTNTGTLTGFGTVASNLQVNGGTFNPTGPITFTGNVDFNSSTAVSAGGGSLSVAGTSTVHAGANVTVAAGITYAGAGSVVVNSGGILTVQGSVSQPVTVAGTINGNATLGGTLTIQAGGHLAPGNSPGTITVGGGLTLDGDYDWDLNGNDNTLAGGTFDKVNGNGPVTLAAAGHVNVNFGGGVLFSNPFWSQPVQWNILSAAGGFTSNALPQVVVNASAYQSLFPMGVFGLSEQANSLVMNWSPNPNSSGWTGSSGGNWNNPAAWFPGSVPTGGIDTQLSFGITSNPTMTNDIPGTFLLNSLTFTSVAPAYALTGNGLNFQMNTAGVLPQIAQNSTNGVAINTPLTLTNNLTVSGTGNIALNGAIGGPGGLIMNGTGILTLGNAANNYSGGTNVLNGVIQVAADSALGTGNVTGASLGTLLFTGSTTTTKSFAMNGGTVSVAAGQTVTFNGSQVSSAYLDGSGTFATNATKGAQFTNVTTTLSVTVASNSAADRFNHFDNSGILNVAANLSFGNTMTFNGFVNQGGGTVTIGASSQVNVSNFQSYGDLTLAVGNPIATQLTNVGTSPLYFNGGSRTLIALPNMPAVFQAGIDLHGQNAIVAGGLFVDNGYLIDSTGTGHTVIADYGALVKGAGFFEYSPITRNGGRVQAGNSPGVASFGQFIFGPGGVSNYVFAIDNATGVAGPTPDANGQVSGWGLINAVRRTVGTLTTSGDFVWTADAENKLLVSLDTLVNPTLSGTDVTGLMANFDPTRSYSWLAAQWSGTYSGPTDAATLDAETGFDTSGFQNPIAGTFGWSLDPAAQSLSLTYSPNAVPEPGTMVMVGAAALFGWRRHLRNRSK